VAKRCEEYGKKNGYSILKMNEKEACRSLRWYINQNDIDKDEFIQGFYILKKRWYKKQMKEWTIKCEKLSNFILREEKTKL
jgi:hypothetical protein